VWIVIARLLYCFDFEAIPVSKVLLSPEAINANYLQGQEPDSLRINWLGIEEAPFPLSIKVRSPQHATLIEKFGKIAVETKY
jgi:hypothetical protein